MSRIAYYRVSTADQSIEAQRGALGGCFDKEFHDEGVSGATLAADRPGFSKLLSYVRGRIRERCESGRSAARAALEATGKTHHGKHGLGRKPAKDAATVALWRQENKASIRATAGHFGISDATVKRYCSASPAQ